MQHDGEERSRFSTLKQTTTTKADSQPITIAIITIIVHHHISISIIITITETTVHCAARDSRFFSTAVFTVPYREHWLPIVNPKNRRDVRKLPKLRPPKLWKNVKRCGRFP
jgi:hypothetical protein